MSRCAHDQSEYRIRKLPRCTKCKTEFVLVMFHYENANQPVYEWECPKCQKSVPRNLLNEEALNEEDKLLHERCENDQKERTRKSNTRKSLHNNKQRKSKSYKTR